MRCSRWTSVLLASFFLPAFGLLFPPAAAPQSCSPMSITSISPPSGPAGTTSVTITGTGFGSSQGTSTVSFNGVLATVTNWRSDGTSITVTVPSGATPCRAVP